MFPFTTTHFGVPEFWTGHPNRLLGKSLKQSKLATTTIQPGLSQITGNPVASSVFLHFGVINYNSLPRVAAPMVGILPC